MNLDNNKKIIIGLIAFFAVVSLGLGPFLHKREAVKIVQEVLGHWKNGNLAMAIDYWENQDDSPPMYGLTSYKIKSKSFGKKDGSRHAKILVELDLSAENILPSGDWMFEVSYTNIGWRVVDFYLSSE